MTLSIIRYSNGCILLKSPVFASEFQFSRSSLLCCSYHSITCASARFGNFPSTIPAPQGRENITIAAPGNYEFDAGGIRSQFGFLVLQTEKGVITRKVIF